MAQYYVVSDELYHHGILGMKWGVRRYQNADGSLTAAGKSRYGSDVEAAKNALKSARATRNKAAGKWAASNYFTVKKAGRDLKKANDNVKKARKDYSSAKKQLSIETKIQKKDAEAKRKEGLRAVDPSLAKNKQTRRVDYDYHNLDELRFRQKYLVSKSKFAKRYEKYDGDTYSAGKKKAMRAALIMATSPDVKYIDLRSGKAKTIKMGKQAAIKTLAMDMGYSEAVSRFGYNKAEEKYKETHKG